MYKKGLVALALALSLLLLSCTEGEAVDKVKEDVIEVDGEEYKIVVYDEDPNEVSYRVKKKAKAKSGPFEISVMLRDDLRIDRVRILSYPYTHGRGVKSEKFLGQFVGKGSEDRLKIGDDIDAVSGATISCRVAAEEARKIIKVVKERYND